ncbi:MAG: glycosyltransferase family 8 protein [Acidobacteria bacterium]|nr:glycosyltransferase family 8 protein [Acidobacteriota bacterium]
MPAAQDPSPVIPIVCAVNRHYVTPLVVMLSSLKQHLRHGAACELYLVHSGIPDATLGVISSILKTHSILLTPGLLAKAPRVRHYPPEASSPLLLPEVLPSSLERVLFLDADMLVLGDIAELWATPLEGHVLAAAADAAVPLCSSPRGVKDWRALGIQRDTPYFNCGVLLIHLGRWRERAVTQRALRYFEYTREPIDFLHQEALNAVLWDDWKHLDQCWNLLASRAGRPFDRQGGDEWKRPGIVHFAGRMKPWRAPIAGPFNAPYQAALAGARPLIAREPSHLRDRFTSIYDRHLRALLYPLEQYLWKHRFL